MVFKQFRLYAFAGVALLGLALAACGGDDDDGALRTKVPGTRVATVAAETKSPAASGATSAPQAEGDTIEVKMTDNAFAPNKITVTAGKTVTFKAKNDGAAVHNMKILTSKTEGKDFASDALVNPGKESKFTAKFTKKGTVQFQCDYHVPDMVGTIEVK